MARNKCKWNRQLCDNLNNINFVWFRSNEISFSICSNYSPILLFSLLHIGHWDCDSKTKCYKWRTIIYSVSPCLVALAFDCLFTRVIWNWTFSVFLTIESRVNASTSPIDGFTLIFHLYSITHRAKYFIFQFTISTLLIH